VEGVVGVAFAVASVVGVVAKVGVVGVADVGMVVARGVGGVDVGGADVEAGAIVEVDVVGEVIGVAPIVGFGKEWACREVASPVAFGVRVDFVGVVGVVGVDDGVGVGVGVDGGDGVGVGDAGVGGVDVGGVGVVDDAVDDGGEVDAGVVDADGEVDVGDVGDVGVVDAFGWGGLAHHVVDRGCCGGVVGAGVAGDVGDGVAWAGVVAIEQDDAYVVVGVVGDDVVAGVGVVIGVVPCGVGGHVGGVGHVDFDVRVDVGASLVGLDEVHVDRESTPVAGGPVGWAGKQRIGRVREDPGTLSEAPGAAARAALEAPLAMVNPVEQMVVPKGLVSTSTPFPPFFV
jgi:hypothetical protein